MRGSRLLLHGVQLGWNVLVRCGARPMLRRSGAVFYRIVCASSDDKFDDKETWLRGRDSNPGPQGYGTYELPLLHPARSIPNQVAYHKGEKPDKLSHASCWVPGWGRRRGSPINLLADRDWALASFGSGQGMRARKDHIVLTADGAYTVVVDPTDRGVGSLNVTVTPRPPRRRPQRDEGTGTPSCDGPTLRPGWSVDCFCANAQRSRGHLSS